MRRGRERPPPPLAACAAAPATAAAAASAPAAAPARLIKLPPNPDTTLVRPRQQRARQRAAEQAVVEQDAAVLRRLLGGIGSAADGPTLQQRQQQQQQQQQRAADDRPPSRLDGCLSSLTLASLLPSAQHSHVQPAAATQQSGLSLAGEGSMAGLGAEPSALTAYISRLEEEGSALAERQVMHVQASTGGSGSQGAFPSPLRASRNPLAPGRREVQVLGKWLEAETLRFNASFGRKDGATPLADFLVQAAGRAGAMYRQAWGELARQVSRQCEHRGRLMADVWVGYSGMLDSVLARVHAAYVAARERAEAAEAALAAAQAQLEQERAVAEALKEGMQEEVVELRAELAAARSRGGSGGSSQADGAGGSRRGTVQPEGGSPGRGVHFRESSLGLLSRGSTVGGRSTLGGAGLRGASMAMGSVIQQLQEAAGALGGITEEDVEALQQQNESLREALDGARQELFDAYRQVAELEQAASAAVVLESRAEAAEGELESAQERLRACTPRPQQRWDELLELVGEDGLKRFHAAVAAHPQWPTDDLAQLLCGAPLHAAAPPPGSSPGDAAAGSDGAAAAAAAAAPGGQPGGQPAHDASSAGDASGSSSSGGSAGSHLREHVQPGLGCLQAVLAEGILSREAIQQAILASDAAPLMQAAGEGPAAEWLAAALSRPVAAPDALADFVAGATAGGLPLSPAYYGCLHQHCRAITLEQATAAVQRARMSTGGRVALLEEEVRALRRECGELRGIVGSYREVEQRRDAARRRREEEAALEKKSPLQQYVELLGSQDEAAWKEWLIGMGQGADVPRLFRHAGKIRNKQLSKRDTEKLVKELWKERLEDPAAAAGKACDLPEFVFQQLQKKVGIVTAVVEAGYNFLFGLWRYQWDADCELFLRIMLGEVKEDVYVAQVRLQEDLEELFAAVDRAKGQATGLVDKDDLRTAFLAYFRVGQPGGKSLKRFDELMQAMDEDQEGPSVEWRRVFEEDREFNQGEFAEAIRDQFLQERVEFLKALEEAVYDECGHEEECGREAVARALLRVDTEMSEKAAAAAAASVFLGTPAGELMGVKSVMRKLSRGVVRRGRQSSVAKGSVVGAAAGLKAKPRRGAGTLNEAAMRALEALRQEWIAREVAKNAPALPSTQG